MTRIPEPLPAQVLIDNQGRPTAAFLLLWSQMAATVNAQEAALAAHETRITALETP